MTPDEFIGNWGTGTVGRRLTTERETSKFRADLDALIDAERERTKKKVLREMLEYYWHNDGLVSVKDGVNYVRDLPLHEEPADGD